MEEEQITCSVCKAAGDVRYHYGAHTCLACRAFFRRTAHNPPQKQCRKTGACYNKPHTVNCMPCRYQRCLEAGMIAAHVSAPHRKRYRRKNGSPQKSESNSQEIHEAKTDSQNFIEGGESGVESGEGGNSGVESGEGGNSGVECGEGGNSGVESGEGGNFGVESTSRASGQFTCISVIQSRLTSSSGKILVENQLTFLKADLHPKESVASAAKRAAPESGASSTLPDPRQTTRMAFRPELEPPLKKSNPPEMHPAYRASTRPDHGSHETAARKSMNPDLCPAATPDLDPTTRKSIGPDLSPAPRKSVICWNMSRANQIVATTTMDTDTKLNEKDISNVDKETKMTKPDIQASKALEVIKKTSEDTIDETIQPVKISTICGTTRDEIPDILTTVVEMTDITNKVTVDNLDDVIESEATEKTEEENETVEKCDSLVNYCERLNNKRFKLDESLGLTTRIPDSMQQIQVSRQETAAQSENAPKSSTVKKRSVSCDLPNVFKSLKFEDLSKSVSRQEMSKTLDEENERLIQELLLYNHKKFRCENLSYRACKVGNLSRNVILPSPNQTKSIRMEDDPSAEEEQLTGGIGGKLDDNDEDERALEGSPDLPELDSELELVAEDVLKIVTSMELRSLEELYTVEESKFLDFKSQQFWDKWCSYSLGNVWVNKFIDSCRNGGYLDFDLLKLMHKKAMKRMIAFIFESEESLHITQDDFVTLLRNRLSDGIMLFHLWSDGALDSEDLKMNYRLGEVDYQLWKKAETQAPSFLQMIKDLLGKPGSSSICLNLRDSFSISFFNDNKLYFLMLGVMLYDPDVQGLQHPHVVYTIQQEYIRMLGRYLCNETPTDASTNVLTIVKCVQEVKTVNQYLEVQRLEK